MLAEQASLQGLEDLEDPVEFQLYDEEHLKKCWMLRDKTGTDGGLGWYTKHTRDYTFKVLKDIPYGPNFSDWLIPSDRALAAARTDAAQHSGHRFKVGCSSDIVGDAMEEDYAILARIHKPVDVAYNPWEAQQPWFQERYDHIDQCLTAFEQSQAQRWDQYGQRQQTWEQRWDYQCFISVQISLVTILFHLDLHHLSESFCSFFLIIYVFFHIKDTMLFKYGGRDLRLATYPCT